MVILVSGCVRKIDKNEIPSLRDDIIIDEKDKDCISDADCVVVSTGCGDCGGDAVNKAYVEKYKSKLAQACKDFKYACDWDYRPTHEIKCVNKKCRLVPK